MNVSERLSRARDAAFTGRHSEAFREYVWYHNNALRSNLRGQRQLFCKKNVDPFYLRDCAEGE